MGFLGRVEGDLRSRYNISMLDPEDLGTRGVGSKCCHLTASPQVNYAVASAGCARCARHAVLEGRPCRATVGKIARGKKDLGKEPMREHLARIEHLAEDITFRKEYLLESYQRMIM